MQEIIREHPYLKGLLISNLGKVFVPKGVKGKKAHWTSGSKCSNGYLHIQFQRKFYNVHRLVAETFLDNPNNLPTVDHIDRNKANNCIENLRWASYNLQGSNQIHHRNNGLSKKVLQFTQNGEFVKEWASTRECDRNGFNHGAVGSCCRGVKKVYKGYIWKYAS